MTVYHSSNVEVPKPSLTDCRPDTDFGAGFYVTESFEMAEKWAYRKNKSSSVINKYELNTSDLKIYKFGIDENWLDFVVNNRNSRTQTIDVSNYDIIEGAAVDDRLFAAIELYENGLVSMKAVIKALNCIDIGNQVCIKTERGLDNIHYIGKTIPSHDRKQYIKQQNDNNRNVANKRTEEILKQNNKPPCV